MFIHMKKFFGWTCFVEKGCLVSVVRVALNHQQILEKKGFLLLILSVLLLLGFSRDVINLVFVKMTLSQNRNRSSNS